MMLGKHFFSYKMFWESPRVSICCVAMAEVYGISVERAREYLKKDCEAGLITGEHPEYSLTCLGYKHLYQCILK